MKYNKGDKMFWKSTGLPAYEKLDDENFGWWVSLCSTYVVEKNVEGHKEYEVHSESEKPLWKKNDKGEDTSLNRFGFKWTDEQVYEYYKGIMFFECVKTGETLYKLERYRRGRR